MPGVGCGRYHSPMPPTPDEAVIAPRPHHPPDDGGREADTRYPTLRTLPGRLPPSEMFPAGRPEIAVRWLRLASGLRVRSVECGPADGPAVFLVHGWACSVYSFRFTLGALAAAGFRVLSADLKGHGLSDKPGEPAEYGTEAMAEHVVQILDALHVERVALVGHSMGGALALDVAMRRPERIPRVALLDSVGLGEARLVRVVRALTPRPLTPLLPRLARRWTVPIILRFAYGRFGGFTARDVDEYWAPTQFPEAVYASRHLAHRFTWSPVPAERLGDLRCPALVLFGTRDRLVSPRSARQPLDALRDGWLCLVEGAGHVALEEQPVEVNRHLVNFLAPELAASR